MAVFLYLQLFILPATPIQHAGDQAVFLVGATRMLEGQVIYRDFFRFVLPGTECIYFLLFKLFGVRAWIPEGVLIFLGLGLVWVSVVISRRLVSGASVFLHRPPLSGYSIPKRARRNPSLVQHAGGDGGPGGSDRREEPETPGPCRRSLWAERLVQSVAGTGGPHGFCHLPALGELPGQTNLAVAAGPTGSVMRELRRHARGIEQLFRLEGWP